MVEKVDLNCSLVVIWLEEIIEEGVGIVSGWSRCA